MPPDVMLTLEWESRVKPVDADDLLRRFRDAQPADGHEPDTWKKIEVTLQENRPLLVAEAEPVRPWLPRLALAMSVLALLVLAAWAFIG